MPDDLLLDDSVVVSTTTSLESIPHVSPKVHHSAYEPPRAPPPQSGYSVGVSMGVVTGVTQPLLEEKQFSGNYGGDDDDRVFYNHQVVGGGDDEVLTSPVKLVQPLPQLHPHPLPSQHGHSHEQLEILYKARGRQLEELTQQLLAMKDDGERHVKILREKIVSPESEMLIPQLIM